MTIRIKKIQFSLNKKSNAKLAQTFYAKHCNTNQIKKRTKRRATNT